MKAGVDFIFVYGLPALGCLGAIVTLIRDSSVSPDAKAILSGLVVVVFLFGLFFFVKYKNRKG